MPAAFPEARARPGRGGEESIGRRRTHLRARPPRTGTDRAHNRAVIRAFHLPGGGEPLVDLALDRVGEARAGGWVWVDVEGTLPAEIDTVARLFSLDPLAVEDVLDPEHFPKVDDYGDHVFVVLHGLGARDDRLETNELDVACGGDFLVTVHRQASPSVEAAIAEARRGGAHSPDRSDLGFARLAEIQARRYLPAVDALEEAIEDLEERAVRGDRSVITDVQALRRDAVVLRRVVGPQREVLVALSRPLSAVLSPAAQLRFASVADHHYRIDESLESARTLLGAILETYRSSVSERTNDVMRVLTVYTALILPLTLIAGVYGMNLARLPGADHPWAFPATVLVMAVLTVAQWAYFVARGFVGRREQPPSGAGGGLARLARIPVSLAETVGDDGPEDSSRPARDPRPSPRP